MTFLDTLIEKGILSANEAGKIAVEAEKSGEDIEKLLAAKGLDPAQVLELRSEYFSIPARATENLQVPFEVLKNVPEESALYYRFVPLGIEDGVLAIGVVNPENIGARDAIQFIASKLGIPYKLYLISSSGFDNIVMQYKGFSGEVNKALTELETELATEKREPALPEVKDISKELARSEIVEEAPVTKIVAVTLRYAIEGNASDIHIEPLEDKLKIRFRVDGVLHTSIVLPIKVHNSVVARIKVLANLKLDEKRKPQDGRFSARIGGHNVDFRVSTFPTYYGEKVVMRILDTSQGAFTLDTLGLTEKNVELLREAMRHPYGIILLTGPTGSGKTTTLYSMLSEVDRNTKNVVSLEDPIEYNISGVSQSQVRPEIDYTFANGLRSILRQDPDVIMVGEIRDKETAQLAIQAALTGHLVFSTLHTNNAAGVIPRLVDMGVDPFLIAPTLVLAIAQRLVKVICDGSQKEVPIEGAIKAMIEKETSDLPDARKRPFLEAKKVFEATPTNTCPTGTRGRIGVFELMQVNKKIERIILENPVEEAIQKAARENGMYTMREDALLKSFTGKVPFEQMSEL